MRRHDPRSNAGTAMAAIPVGLLALPVPADVAPGRSGSPVRHRIRVAVPTVLPVQQVVTVTPRPVVLKTAAPRRGDPTVSLTFDDGPDPIWTPQVLELLRRHSAVATFCVCGNQARKHPQLVRDIVAAGMRLCNHTRTHPADLTLVPEPAQRDEVLGTSADLRAAVDAPVAYFRAPGGHWSPPVLQLAVDQGMQPRAVDRPAGLEQPGRLRSSAPWNGTASGRGVLSHDGGGHRAQTVEAVS